MNGLVILYFADKLNIFPILRVLVAEVFPQIFKILLVSSKGNSNVVHPVLQPEINDIDLIIVGDSW